MKEDNRCIYRMYLNKWEVQTRLKILLIYYTNVKLLNIFYLATSFATKIIAKTNALYDVISQSVLYSVYLLLLVLLLKKKLRLFGEKYLET